MRQRLIQMSVILLHASMCICVRTNIIEFGLKIQFANPEQVKAFKTTLDTIFIGPPAALRFYFFQQEFIE
jgi:hypothetical protein